MCQQSVEKKGRLTTGNSGSIIKSIDSGRHHLWRRSYWGSTTLGDWKLFTHESVAITGYERHTNTSVTCDAHWKSHQYFCDPHWINCSTSSCFGASPDGLTDNWSEVSV